jgi:hypothetical protein
MGRLTSGHCGGITLNIQRLALLLNPFLAGEAALI